MSQILVFCEFSGNQVKKGSLELLNAARSSGRKVIAAAIGAGSSALAPMLASYGATEVLVSEGPELKNYNPEAYTNVCAQFVQEAKATLVLASASSLARDLMPRVAARLNSGVASDCTVLQITADKVIAKKPLYAGKCMAEVEFNDSPVQFILMRPNQLPVGDEKAGAQAPVKTVASTPQDYKTQIKDVVKGASEKADLTEANVIVSGGRGMQSAENFKILNELADTIDATVGASRAVCDAGWVPHSIQVGQTGKTVAPSLYIACGISGAIQHLAGMSGSKVIVAINKDADAPIFQKATYGIVGDVFQVVPKLTEEFKKIM